MVYVEFTMSQLFQHLPPEISYQANLYPASPIQQNAAAPTLGVCVSGGGSRALSAALGQLSALATMAAPDGQTVMSHVKFLSSVSGGSWASVLYTFLPQTINNQPVSDADFLIQPEPPGNLVKGGATTKSPANVCYMGPFCLGLVPQRFNPQVVAAFLYTLYQWGFFGDRSRWSWFWIAGVGEIVLKPFGLYGAFYDPNVNFLQPANFFSLSADYVAANITPCNAALTASQFYLPRPNRPTLIVNANLLQNFKEVDSPQIPMQARPTATSILGQSPDGTIQGGGGVESFAFTSNLTGVGNCPAAPALSASVAEDRRYSLCDIAGCSSAFFAEFLLQYVKGAINDLVNEVEQYLVNCLHIDKTLAALFAKALEFVADDFLEAEAAQVIPLYNYWPLSQVNQPNPANTPFGFSDGGDFDNSGVLGLLAQTNVNNIISFINTETPLSKNSAGTIVVDTTLSQLFGKTIDSKTGQWVYTPMSPSQPMSYIQVFDTSHGEFEACLEGLFHANSAGGPAVFQQTLTTVHNPVANIVAGRRVTVLWFYGTRVNNWQNAITDANLKADIAAGQASPPSGPLGSFPNYNTITQICLEPEAVNMLAQLSAWCVQQSQSQILAML